MTTTVDFRTVASRFATGVAVATSTAGGVPFATTVNAFTTVSLDPTLLLVCLRTGSRLLGAIERSGVFAVTVLSGTQRDYAQRFASSRRPPGEAAFAGIAAEPSPVTGCPLLSDGVAYFDCRMHRTYPGGDHAVLIGEVASYGLLKPEAPLVFVNQRYADLDLEPLSPAR
ncbi:flavin reductase family protein [Catenuloplanes indicus]|uniref:3-hydroxy-9,10-secoandrosta-1,3,5(10)-triene-9, 17-dione monooxygenase reductase component n=1 Tax=Catenuloplanes indicus TaxID=137267 RepID=A0AAE4AYD4_9ACTN|nr:flavin reductase family protein [Catenuloplanes indicus]MDQ0364923.1 3-hydroxy-9,10-secoandrosta-1,3,5(10)-triene-9,17-dione monooxygenase reductase component [Catenuloplanes indicus]